MLLHYWFIVPILICFTYLLSTSSAATTLLPIEEVEALKEIAIKLGKKDWNFDADPCSPGSGWSGSTVNAIEGSANNVTCNCSFTNDTFCHIKEILLTYQNLSGVLPPELVKLPYIQHIDFTRNYLNGSIPREWGLTRLERIKLIGNRLTGPIPKELCNISTLLEVTLEYNQFLGPIPPELGNLSNLERILLSSNKFVGILPQELAKLTNMTDFRISDNNFTGKIPNFIQYWPKLKILHIQASGMEGPIPSVISLLTKMTDMKLSDIEGSVSPFPQIENMTELKTLVLRSCNIGGKIPEFRNFLKLKHLDLSFNKLIGQIPISFNRLSFSELFLSGNMLGGAVPIWMLEKDKGSWDLSYNNFTVASSDAPNCQQRRINLFGSSTIVNTSGIVPCLKSLDCTKKLDSFNINCGGSQVTDAGNKTYEEDIDPSGASQFFLSRYKWVTSTTGTFLSGKDEFIVTNKTRLLMNNTELYTTARVAATSLTYYASCMLNRSYTVNLHFAEIVFTSDKTFSSLGRRIFDVYIQGKRVLKDFNIADEALGAGKEVVKKFDVLVTSGTLEIRFFWAGKGTTRIPTEGVYGPLISAISVVSDFKPPTEDKKKKISLGLIAGVVVSVVLLLFGIMGILWWKGCLGRKNLIDQVLRGLDLQTGSFTLRQIKAATNNFDAANKIGEGGFGPVYKGLLSDGLVIAVKQLSSKSKQGNREFVNEIGMISAIQHANLVKLYGCCTEGNQLLLVYEYLENNSLARAMFGPEEFQIKLDWKTRRRICIGIARGLAYLHEGSRLKIVHRDIKATNVLLDQNLDPKISDFGLAKLDEEENTHMSTRIAGTYGYMAPEYAMRGHLTDKADVYSFGIVALEIVSGRANANYKAKDEAIYLIDWAMVLEQKGDLIDLVDPRLGTDYNKQDVLGMINIALSCTNASSTLRPTMSSVVSMLEGRSTIQNFVSNSSISIEDLKSKEIKYNNYISRDIDSQTQSMLIEGPWTGSSTSASDLYPVNLDSQYWDNRDNRSMK